MGAIRAKTDLLQFIADLLEALCVPQLPFADRLRRDLDRFPMGKLARLVERYQGSTFALTKDDSVFLEISAERVQEKEAAEAMHEAFVDAFGRGELGLFDLKSCKGHLCKTFIFIDSSFKNKKKRVEQSDRFLVALFGAVKERSHRQPPKLAPSTAGEALAA